MRRRWEELDAGHRHAIVMFEDERAASGSRLTNAEIAENIEARVRFGCALTDAERAQMIAIVRRLDAPYEPPMRLARHDAEAWARDMARAFVAIGIAIAHFVAGEERRFEGCLCCPGACRYETPIATRGPWGIWCESPEYTGWCNYAPPPHYRNGSESFATEADATRAIADGWPRSTQHAPRLRPLPVPR